MASALEDFINTLNKARGFQTLYFQNHEGAFKVPNGYASWLEYWEKRTGRKSGKCQNLLCKSDDNEISDLEGCHVDVVGRSGIWLIPMCHCCNDWRNRDMMKSLACNLIEVPANILVPIADE